MERLRLRPDLVTSLRCSGVWTRGARGQMSGARGNIVSSVTGARDTDTDTDLYPAADRGGQLEPVQEAASAGHTLAVEGVAVGGVTAHVSPLGNTMMMMW